VPVRLAARRVAAVALAAGLLLAALSASARAGTYVVHTCQTPGGAPAPAAGWRFTTVTARINSVNDLCPGATLSFRMNPGVVHPRDDATRLMFQAPPDTTVVHYRMWRHVRLGAAERYYYSPLEVEAGDSAELRVPSPCGGVGASRACSSVGVANDPFAAANLVDRTPPRPLQRFGMYLSCGHYGAGAPDCAALSPIAAEATIHRVDTTLADHTPPSFATEPVGSLRDGAGLSGVKSLATIVTDRGGGVAFTALEIDGAIVARATFGDAAGTCREPYTAVVPCPATASGTLSVDTAALPDGAHQLRVLATDAAGNTTAWGPVAFSSDNARRFCDPHPAAVGGALKLETRLVPARRPDATPVQRLMVGMGEGATVTARLTDAAGAPVPGAAVCVVTRPADDAPLTVVARLSTDGDGRVGTSLAPGTSRQVWVVHRAGAAAVAGKAVLRVRAGITLKPGRKRVRAGARFVMLGRLEGRPIPRNGVLVNIQAKQGRRWQTFRQVRVRGSGRFRVRYRFHGGPGVRRYALRAAVPEQGAYHYAPATSRPFRVRVVGRPARRG
jgi:hypothetical protein